MASPKHLLLGAGLVLSLVTCVVLYRNWLTEQSDPALTGDRRAYARATGALMTPAGVTAAAPFSDGPGIITVSDALNLMDSDLAAATALLGPPNTVLTGKDLTVALWWNAVIPSTSDDTQPPAFHLRLDLPVSTARISRVACMGALLAETASNPR